MQLQINLSELVSALESEITKYFKLDEKLRDKIVAILVSDILENSQIKKP